MKRRKKFEIECLRINKFFIIFFVFCFVIKCDVIFERKAKHTRHKHFFSFFDNNKSSSEIIYLSMQVLYFLLLYFNKNNQHPVTIFFFCLLLLHLSLQLNDKLYFSIFGFENQFHDFFVKKKKQFLLKP